MSYKIYILDDDVLHAKLVAANLASARDIAISASNEFGVPLLDLDAISTDMDTVRSVSEKLMQKR
jgi:type IV pilus assembly protein PilB